MAFHSRAQRARPCLSLGGLPMSMPCRTARSLLRNSRSSGVQLSCMTEPFSKLDEGGQPPTMIGGTAKHHVRGLRPAQEKMRIVLPSEPDTAVDLHILLCRLQE